MRITTFALCVLWALLRSEAVAAEDEVRVILDRCVVPKTQTGPAVGGFGTMNHSPLMGNGCLMITVGSGPGSLTFYLGKTDFWRDKGKEKDGAGWQSGNVLPGYVSILPSVRGPCVTSRWRRPGCARRATSGNTRCSSRRSRCCERTPRRRRHGETG